jgi:hypothetical protein
MKNSNGLNSIPTLRLLRLPSASLFTLLLCSCTTEALQFPASGSKEAKIAYCDAIQYTLPTQTQVAIHDKRLLFNCPATGAVTVPYIGSNGLERFEIALSKSVDTEVLSGIGTCGLLKATDVSVQAVEGVLVPVQYQLPRKSNNAPPPVWMPDVYVRPESPASTSEPSRAMGTTTLSISEQTRLNGSDNLGLHHIYVSLGKVTNQRELDSFGQCIERLCSGTELLVGATAGAMAFKSTPGEDLILAKGASGEDDWSVVAHQTGHWTSQYPASPDSEAAILSYITWAPKPELEAAGLCESPCGFEGGYACPVGTACEPGLIPQHSPVKPTFLPFCIPESRQAPSVTGLGGTWAELTWSGTPPVARHEFRIHPSAQIPADPCTSGRTGNPSADGRTIYFNGLNENTSHTVFRCVWDDHPRSSSRLIAMNESIQIRTRALSFGDCAVSEIVEPVLSNCSRKTSSSKCEQRYSSDFVKAVRTKLGPGSPNMGAVLQAMDAVVQQQDFSAERMRTVCQMTPTILPSGEPQ